MDLSQNVLVLGGASWNTMVHLPEFPTPKPQTISNARFVEGAGSTGIGKAFSLKALGYNPTLHITLGDDDYAEKVIKACADREISTIVDRYQGETAQHLNLMDRQGGRISIFKTNGPEEVVVDKERMEREIAKADVIYVNLAASAIALLDLVAAAEAKIVVDLHDFDPNNHWYDQFIDVANIVQLSDEKVGRDDRIANALLARGSNIVVVTRGKEGATIYSESESLVVEPSSAKLKDSNGAGDTFCVSFVQNLLSGRSLSDAGKIAAKLASQTVETDEISPLQFHLA